MKDWQSEINQRVDWIKNILNEAHAKGIILGLSGGKDSAVVAALAKQATPHVLGVMMPCGNASQDILDAQLVADKFHIETIEVNLGNAFDELANTIEASRGHLALSTMPKSNIKPRLRMTTLYAIAQEMGYLVAGTGNKSEATMGYFTKWGDGANDFNPIADLTVTEVRELGRALAVPESILTKQPSAGLWTGQTDEAEMGITYAAIDEYLLTGKGTAEDVAKIKSTYTKTQHKRELPKTFP